MPAPIIHVKGFDERKRNKAPPTTTPPPPIAQCYQISIESSYLVCFIFARHKHITLWL
jgi:hypothetical protein